MLMTYDQFYPVFEEIASLSSMSPDLIMKRSHTHYQVLKNINLKTYQAVIINVVLGKSKYLHFIDKPINKELPLPETFLRLCNMQSGGHFSEQQKEEAKPVLDKDRKARAIFFLTSKDVIKETKTDCHGFSNLSSCMNMSLKSVIDGYRNSSERKTKRGMNLHAIEARTKEIWNKHEEKYK